MPDPHRASILPRLPVRAASQRRPSWRILARTAVCLVVSGIAPVTASEPTSDVQARRLIFGVEPQGDVLEIRRQGMKLPLEQRFDYLLKFVFPSHSDHILVAVDFTPAYPSAPVIAQLGIDSECPALHFEPSETCSAVGGTLVSPAIDLVETATDLGRLGELRQWLEERRSNQQENPRAYWALAALVGIAGNDFEAARDAISRLREVAAHDPVVDAERGPEAVAMWMGVQHSETHDAARDLAFLVYEQARSNHGPRSERWHRQVYALKHMLGWRSEQNPVQPAGAPAASLSHWRQVSRMTAETCGKGFPVARWDTRSGRAQHITCHDHDYLYYVSPLTGDFEVEGDFTTFDYRDLHLAFGNVWAGPSYTLQDCLYGDFRRDHPPLPMDPPLTRMFSTMRVRLVVRQGKRTTYANGRKLFEVPHPEGSDPWIAIHSPWYANGQVHNLRITGSPQVLEEVPLATSAQLPGWLPYFDESAGPADSDWHLAETPLSAAASSTANTAGTASFGPPVHGSAKTELVGRRRSLLAGSFQESLLRYHRPMLEDGVITYEFFYRPGESEVHPALGRLCLMLHPSGVGEHWLTDGKFDRTGLDPANLSQTSAHRRFDRPLPLRLDAWNQVQLAVQQNTVHLKLNGQLVFSRELEATSQRTFGLFHYADQTEARVRNIRWRGEWPRQLAPPPQQQLADTRVEQLLGAPEELPVVFTHDFSDGLPSERFLMMGTGWEDDTELLPTGVRMKRAGGDYARYALIPQLTLSGDFDITVAFDRLTTAAVEGGESNIQLLAALDDERSTECRVYRKHYFFAGGRSEQLAQAAVFQRRNGETDYSYPASPPEESSAGQLRMARRGSQLYFLFAEHDSSEFRLFHSQQVPTADTRPAGVRLVLESHKPGGYAEVVWKRLTIRAEAAAGPALSRAWTIAELDRQREQLPAKTHCNFAKDSDQVARAFWGAPERMTRTKDGLTVEAVGADQWTAAGVTSQVGLEGDFDVTLDLDVLHMDRPAAHGESTVYLQAELDDERGTAVEMKYAVSPSGIRAAEIQLNRKQGDGVTDYQELSSKQAKSVQQLRLARRDGIMYLIFQARDGSPPQVLGRVVVGDAAVPVSRLRAFVHTGGAGRKTIVRFRKLTLHAHRLFGPARLEGE